MGKIKLGNKCDVWKTQVRAESGAYLTAYVKHLPPRELFIECIAAQIGRCLGLSIPRPMLVLVEPVRLPELNLDRSTILFGSEDAQYPSLTQHTSLSEVIDQLKKWPKALEAGCFDEWIANPDRHAGNILYNGRNKFSLIDHSHAIPAEHSSRNISTKNTFLEIVKPEIGDEIGLARALKKLKYILPNYPNLVEENWKEIAGSSAYIEDERADIVITFLLERIEVITNLIGENLGDYQRDMYADKN